MPQLAAAVQCIWTLEGIALQGADPDPIFPDGCTEIVVHLGEPFDLLAPAGQATRQASILFAGQLSSQLLLRPAGRVLTLGVRFHPCGAAAFLGEPQRRLTGDPVALDALAPNLASALARVRRRSDTLESAVEGVQGVLCRRMDASRIDPRVAHAVRLIEATAGRLSVERVAAGAEVTRRHLERRFLDQVGVTPKRLARIQRFQRALRALDVDGARGALGETAAECGYADQSHFVRDFRMLAGCSPSTHMLRRAELTGFFIAGHAPRTR